jgi:lipid-A-disaccharide synthase
MSDLSVFVVAGESSGDVLGAHLMAALRRRTAVRFSGVGGPAMSGEGLAPLFPMSDVAVMGIGPVLARLPLILRRIRETAAAAIAARPDVLVLIDSPDFCHRVATRVRRARPQQRIVLWVSPTVWAWRPGRAAKIARFTDRLMALLPFEPAVHAALGGPPTTYVGHPFLDHLAEVRPVGGRSLPRPGERPFRIVVLPGSRHSEIDRLIDLFGATLGRIAVEHGPIEVVLPAVDHLAEEIRRRVAGWPVVPRVVTGREAKFEAFRTADAALAASGTVTLELALAGLPTVAAYRLDRLGRLFKPLVGIPAPIRPILPVASMLLPNLIVGDKAMPEYLDGACRPETLAADLAALLVDGDARRRQLAAFARLDQLMRVGLAASPADTAAEVVLEVAANTSEGSEVL